ncbi:Formate dehydrogenase, nitrate-inducible, iron-sulfur subunit [Pelotomaculum schinkii]|uniref:Formate dehydrogenase, nitrate-inducible, iron-sulfur subunit n=1 Tax=Pelotomaculum schinkii TaxID=78350 RepID=A0A4Y7R8C3_9FIRM|nr:4Fe-4S dicluster domain-containing protein [Pelotomaculum schinkii]TEB05218.1 Formate dehydrogenase, nitrate-inducible, iron-sulfur subunit [Pelotomaculum schinkii]
MSKSVLVDITRCIGCRSCMVSCKSWNDLPAEPSEFSNNWDSPGKLSADTWTNVSSYVLEEGDQLKWRFVKRQCMHCNEPACESACFTHSFVKTKEGAVIYKPTELNEDYCVGCRYCMIACPFDVPGFQWDKALPYVQKCRFCYDRTKEEGLEPACVTACLTGALTYGERDEMLALAQDRMSKDPRYIKHIYGEKEYGGTSWLYISDVPFDQIGFKTEVFNRPVTQRSIPSLTWDVLKWTPYIFVGWGALLTAMRAYTKRRAEVHNEEDLYGPVDPKE